MREAPRVPFDDPDVLGTAPQMRVPQQEGPIVKVRTDRLGTIHAGRAFDPAERRFMHQVVSTFDELTAPWRAAVVR